MNSEEDTVEQFHDTLNDSIGFQSTWQTNR